MASRGVIVAKIKPGSEEQVAEIFAESDATDLPHLTGVKHRSLFVLDDVYVHLVETEEDVEEAVGRVRGHELFKEISQKLDPYIQPYDPETWKSPADAMAREIYSWDADGAEKREEAREPQIRSVDDLPADTRRGGDVRTLLSPKTAGSTSGFMGVATIAPGDKISEHYHPYSEEFIYVIGGELVAQLDGAPHQLAARQALLIPKNVRHRLVNEGDEEVSIVFHLGPLAPKPELGHVDTE
jgi:putative monooxygenase